MISFTNYVSGGQVADELRRNAEEAAVCFLDYSADVQRVGFNEIIGELKGRISTKDDRDNLRAFAAALLEACK